MKERKLGAEDETNIMELQMYSKLLANARFTSKSLLIQAERSTQLDNNETEPFESRCSNFKQLSQDSGRRKRRNYQFNSSFSLSFSLQALA